MRLPFRHPGARITCGMIRPCSRGSKCVLTAPSAPRISTLISCCLTCQSQESSHAFFDGCSWSLPSLRISGQVHAANATTMIVPMPPLTTEATGPKKRATVPDSNSPNSLEALMNTLLTAETRPRISLGVRNCTKLCRTTTLMLSDAPQTASISSDNQNDVESPKTMVTMPNVVT